MSILKLGSSVVGIALLLGVTSAAAREASPKEVGVSRLVLAHGIDSHEPQQPSSTFKTHDDRVYAFVELQNPTKAAGKIEVVFEPPQGAALAPITLDFGDSARFRTWAFTRQAHAAGEWGVVVRDDKGRLLAHETFRVEN
ncbi:MAG TPA: DUF2914 domain-containing protein [Labilithrix sp.]|jgi:hypothetical protein